MKRELGEVENLRLESLCEKTMRWNFHIEHIAGASNFGPDALSRYPGSKVVTGGLGAMLSDEDVSWSADLESEVVAKVCATKGVKVISLAECNALQSLMRCIPAS